mgnify:CR=1 FL=1|jgi:hypothetical protein
MSPFVIFAIILTVLYLIYYSVVVLHDLYGKKTGKKQEEETFEISTMEEQDESVQVNENENGFSIGDNEYETADNTACPPAVGVKAEDAPADKPSPETKVLEKVKGKISSKLEEVNSYMSDPYNNEQLYKLMMGGGRMDGRPKIEAIPIKNEI